MNYKKKLENLIKKEINKIPKPYGIFLSGGIDSGLLCALSDSEIIASVYLPFGSRFDEWDSVLKTVKHLKKKVHKIELNPSEFKNVFRRAVRIIGRPIRHYNIIPFYIACREMKDKGMTRMIVGDGPDETMCGYTRHLIMNYIYSIKRFEAFNQYEPLIGKVLKNPAEQYAILINKDIEEVKPLMVGYSLIDGMCNVDINLMRKDMDDMTDRIAEHFGITLYRPYQDNIDVDKFMFRLPPEEKIHNVEYGKFLLRKVASKYLPKEIAWKKQKIGGPLIPVNRLMGWSNEEFDSSYYYKVQERILRNK